MSQTKYTRLTLVDREILSNRLANGEPVIKIARAMRVHHTTIYREIKRNSSLTTNTTRRVNRPHQLTLDGRNFRGTAKVDEIRAVKDRYRKRLCRFRKGKSLYDPLKADRLSLERRSSCQRRMPLLLTEDYALSRDRIIARLGERSSPSQVRYHLMKQGLPVVSENTIYRYIWRYAPELKALLRRRGRPRRNPERMAWNKSKCKRSIRSRPKAADNLVRFGDLEGDTVFGKDSKDRLLTHVDRLTGLGSISLVLGYNATNISKQTTADLSRVFGRKIRTITYDNGSEFAAWQNTESAIRAESADRRIKTKVYFADPYSSYQRGRNENFNGLVRDFFPKGTDFKTLTKKDILKVESILNNRERERFNGLTPIEMTRLCALGVGV